MSKKTDWEGIARNSQSADFRAKNPHLFYASPVSTPDSVLVVAPPKKKVKRRKEMNKTETEFAALLDAKRNRNEIIAWEYEELTLRWPDGMAYTPDFKVVDFVIEAHGLTLEVCTLIEVKGAHSWAKDVVKFRAARDKWRKQYHFQFWQKINGIWQETR